MTDLEALWTDLLAGDSQRLQRAWTHLDDAERQAVLAHLRRMRDEEGWHPAQREAAAAAIQAIHDLAQ